MSIVSILVGRLSSRNGERRRFFSTIGILALLLVSSISFSPMSKVHADTSGLVGYWKFDEGSGSAAQDSSGYGNTGTVQNANWTTGAVNGALSFNGIDSTVDTNQAVVNTLGNFSVAAWVKLTRLDTYFTAVSQDGNNVSAFYLQYKPSSSPNCPAEFGFTLMQADTADVSRASCAGSTFTPTVGVWYHLAGVYDATNHVIRLYVNGVLQSSVAFTSPWKAQGEMVIGRGKWGGQPVDFFAGAIDEVRVYNSILSDTDVKVLAQPPNAAGYWSFDEGNGTIANDASGNGNSGTVNGASWTSGHLDSALSFNGSSSTVDTNKAMLNTTSSFSVAAWVELNSTSNYATALSQDGSNVSAFYLQYKPSSSSNCAGRFGFALLEADTTDVTGAVCAGSSSGPTTNTWYQLTGVYDASSHTASLYLNGTLQSFVPFQVSWQAQGETVIGRGKWGGNPVDFWPGLIDEVHVYNRALSAAEVRTLANAGSTTSAHFANPILTKYSFGTAADPSAMRWNGNYYFTGSTNDNKLWIWKTPTITGLGGVAPVNVWVAPSTGAYSGDVWAPELDYINGNWYIYFAADNGGDNNTHRIFVLKGNSQDPQGSYTFEGQINDPSNIWAIDPGIVQDGNSLYMVWSGWPSNGAGFPQNLYIAPMSDPLHISGNRVEISAPTQSWETQGVAINEGPVAHIRNNIVYITFSASASWTDNYDLGVLMNSSGNLLNAASWTKVGPIFQQGNGVYGTGSFQWIPSEDGTEDWFLYHATDVSGCGWGCRSIRLQKMSWNSDGTPNLGTPVPAGAPLQVPSGE